MASDSAILLPIRAPVDDVVTLVAIYDPQAGEPGLDQIPREVAMELNLTVGQRITVTKRKLNAVQEARCLQEGADHDTRVNPLRVLQAVINRSVQASNVGIHPQTGKQDDHRQILVSEMDAPNFVWWLYVWLGASKIMEATAMAQRVQDEKKKRGR